MRVCVSQQQNGWATRGKGRLKYAIASRRTRARARLLPRLPDRLFPAVIHRYARPGPWSHFEALQTGPASHSRLDLHSLPCARRVTAFTHAHTLLGPCFRRRQEPRSCHPPSLGPRKRNELHQMRSPNPPSLLTSPLTSRPLLPRCQTQRPLVAARSARGPAPRRPSRSLLLRLQLRRRARHAVARAPA